MMDRFHTDVDDVLYLSLSPRCSPGECAANQRRAHQQVVRMGCVATPWVCGDTLGVDPGDGSGGTRIRS